MDDRLMQFRIGVMVVATILIGGILIVIFGKLPTLGAGKYELITRFDDAPGVSENTPVRRSGILVGRVKKVEFDADRKVLVSVDLNDDFQIRKDEVVKIVSTLLGDAELQVVPDPKLPKDPSFYQPGALLDGRVTPNALNSLANLENQFGTTAKSLSETSDEIRALAKSVNDRIDGNRQSIDNIVRNTETSLAGITQTVDAINGILSNEELKGDIRSSIKDFSEFMVSAKGAAGDVQAITSALQKNVGKLGPLTDELAQRGPAITKNIDEGLLRLNNSLAQIERFTLQLNSDKGSVGQLLNNPELYQSLNEAANNINDITRRMKPIVEDARVLSDRVSRNPGIILRDALKPGAGTKWTTPERTGRMEREHFQEFERGAAYYE